MSTGRLLTRLIAMVCGASCFYAAWVGAVEDPFAPVNQLPTPGTVAPAYDAQIEPQFDWGWNWEPQWGDGGEAVYR